MEENFDDNDIFINQFIIESEEHIINIETLLLGLEKTLDSFDPEEINSLFRSIHTIKGLAGMLDFPNLFEFSHSWETLLDNVRKKKQVLNKEVIDVSFLSLDLLIKIVNSIKETKKDSIDISFVTSKLNILLGEDFIEKKTDEKDFSSIFDIISPFFQKNISSKEKEVLLAETQLGKNIYQIKLFLNKDCFSKDISYFSVCINLEMFGDIINLSANIDEIADIQDFDPETFDLEVNILFSSEEEKEKLYNIVKNKEIIIDKIFPVSIEEDIKEKEEEIVEKKETNLVKDIKDNSKSKNLNTQETIRVDTSKLDILLTLIGEQVISKTQLEYISNSLINITSYDKINKNDLIELSNSLNEKLSTFSRLNAQLQETVMRIRMLPIGTVFSRFTRVVRELSKDLNKKIELIIDGEDTELDKTIIEEISDPLLHILRNSIDHGIEKPSERIIKGKNETGMLYLNAYQQGNSIIIVIKDDGKGIKIERIREKAIEKELITKDTKLTDKEIINLIFEAGFSTAEEVTGTSGRGVGMDVVRKNISHLKGTIEIQTEEDIGTTIIIKLPLTLAIIQSLIINVSGSNFALPISTVIESYRATPDEIKMLDGHPILKLRDNVLPVLFFEDYFKLEKKVNKGKYIYIVILGIAEKKVAFIVSSFVGQQEIVIKPINDPFVKVDGIAGAAFSGEDIILIIDPVAIIKDSYKSLV